MDTSFTNYWDVMPANRIKWTHGTGAVCPFEINIADDSNYTGLLKPGKVEGLIRLGTGSDLTSPTNPGLTLGGAIKFLRSGTNSGNALFHYVTLPTDNFNFFGFQMSNHIIVSSPTAGTPLSRLLASVMTGVKYCETKSCVTKVGISDLSLADQDGNFEEHPDFPYKIDLYPNTEIAFKSERPTSMKEFLGQFESLPKGTKLYTMKAMQNPDDQDGFLLGELVTTEQCVSSYFGDTRMHFRHQW